MPRPSFTYQPPTPGTRARRGAVDLGHTVVQTPQFMPVGTQGSVRAQRIEDLAPAGATMLLANTFHLCRQPGADVLRRLGGLRRQMGWSGGVLTDSGGYQVFSLGAQVDEDGARVRHPGSGATLHLTPEGVIRDQAALGADVAMVLDHCVPGTADHATAADALTRTLRWAERALKAREGLDVGVFGIVQGACHADLRRQAARALSDLPFEGIAIGGLAVGESKGEREDMTAVATAELPHDRPRYLMGVGTPLDLLEAVHRGVDLFDCVLPTALAQRGRAHTRHGWIDLRRGVYELQDRPLDEACGCPVCRTTSRAWLRHLFVAREPSAWSLVGLHNLHAWLGLMARIRSSLDDGCFEALYHRERASLDAADLEHPPTPGTPKRRRVIPHTLGRWTLHHAPAFGDQPAFVSVRDQESGEVMHSVTRPDDEARALYVDQPNLREVAFAGGDPLVIWDVGLGAATNAVEIVRAWEDAWSDGARRPLTLISFERDLDALRLALANHDHFPRLRHAGPPALLRDGSWRGPRGVTWELRHGDFWATHHHAPPPDLVIHDPFSPRVDGPLWGLRAFQTLVAAARGREMAVLTYSRATSVRAAMLVAGLYVGPGRPTGPKSETTRAWTTPGRGPLLGAAFLHKWRSSSAPWPADVAEGDRPAFAAALHAHPQLRAEPDPTGSTP